jgi:hypothetical protein
MQISLQYISDAPLNPAREATLKRCLFDCLQEHPDCAEGGIKLGDVEHYFGYEVVDDEVIEVVVLPRGVAEILLNKIDLSTHEAFNPLPGRHDERWGRP